LLWFWELGYRKKEEYKNIYTKSIAKKVNELVNIGDFKAIQKYSNILIEMILTMKKHTDI